MHCVTLIPSRNIALSYLFAKVYIANKFLMSLLKTPLKNPAYVTGLATSTIRYVSNNNSMHHK